MKQRTALTLIATVAWVASLAALGHTFGVWQKLAWPAASGADSERINTPTLVAADEGPVHPVTQPTSDDRERSSATPAAHSSANDPPVQREEPTYEDERRAMFVKLFFPDSNIFDLLYGGQAVVNMSVSDQETLRATRFLMWQNRPRRPGTNIFPPPMPIVPLPDEEAKHIKPLRPKDSAVVRAFLRHRALNDPETAADLARSLAIQDLDRYGLFCSEDMGLVSQIDPQFKAAMATARTTNPKSPPHGRELIRGSRMTGKAAWFACVYAEGDNAQNIFTREAVERYQTLLKEVRAEVKKRQDGEASDKGLSDQLAMILRADSEIDFGAVHWLQAEFMHRSHDLNDWYLTKGQWITWPTPRPQERIAPSLEKMRDRAE